MMTLPIPLLRHPSSSWTLRYHCIWHGHLCSPSSAVPLLSLLVSWHSPGLSWLSYHSANCSILFCQPWLQLLGTAALLLGKSRSITVISLWALEHSISYPSCPKLTSSFCLICFLPYISSLYEWHCCVCSHERQRSCSVYMFLSYFYFLPNWFVTTL